MCKNYLGLVQVVNLNFGYCKANLVRNLGWNTGHTLPCRSWDAGRGRDHLLRLQWKDCFLNLETQWQIYGCCSSQCVADLKVTKIRETVFTNFIRDLKTYFLLAFWPNVEHRLNRLIYARLRNQKYLIICHHCLANGSG